MKSRFTMQIVTAAGKLMPDSSSMRKGSQVYRLPSPLQLLTIAAALCFTSCASIERAMDFMTVDDCGRASIDVAAIRQLTRQDCSIACLKAVAGFWGVTVSQEQIMADIGKPGDEHGYTLGQIRDWARSRGLAAFVVRGDIDFLAKQTAVGRPVIVTYHRSGGNHSVVVLSVDRNSPITVMDPAKGRNTSITADVLRKNWSALGYPALLIARLDQATTNRLPSSIESVTTKAPAEIESWRRL